MTCIKSSVYDLDEQPEETLFVIYSRNKCNSFDEERISKMKGSEILNVSERLNVMC